MGPWPLQDYWVLATNCMPTTLKLKPSSASGPLHMLIPLLESSFSQPILYSSGLSLHTTSSKNHSPTTCIPWLTYLFDSFMKPVTIYYYLSNCFSVFLTWMEAQEDRDQFFLIFCWSLVADTVPCLSGCSVNLSRVTALLKEHKARASHKGWTSYQNFSTDRFSKAV